ncbi:hypothetical protein SAMN04487996_101401 [Dyadobacter soli]|uniref:Uncharacterized protein n=2 Tax=Dyadobacter soli TaxID=659014 RepID=A0A1G6W2W2_9BACT|nr:hypothetical protein SAMN04487996_101401 [Dyadobacter soli]
MPHMKSKVLTVAAAAGLLFAVTSAHAQVRQPAPTGQVPRAYSGVQSAPAATYKPKPTGQIAPEAPGQLGTIVQPAPAVAPVQKVSDVQDLGFEVNSRPVNQQGMVPKVNTSQDPRTMPERYQPQVIQQQSAVTAGQVQQVQMQQVPTTGAPAAGSPAAGSPAAGTSTVGSPAQGTQAAPAQTTMPTNTGRTIPQPGQVNTQSVAPQPAQSGAVRP